MADNGPIKRLRYFDHQFLRVEDFRDEQTYHREMRRTHNLAFRHWGVVTGLELQLSADQRQVRVTAGVAIDRDGQEIVLRDPHDFEVAVPSGTARTLYVSAEYNEVPTDETTETGTAPEARRTEERPLLRMAETLPTDPGKQLVLGWVQVAADRTVTLAEGTEPNRRRSAGAVGGEMTARGLTFVAPGVSDAQSPRLRMTTAGRLDVSSRLQVAENVVAAKDLTVSGASTLTGAVTLGGTLTVPAGGSDLSTTDGDVRIGSATQRLKIGVATTANAAQNVSAGDVRLRAHGGSNRLILGAGTRDVLTVASDAGGDNVGVGTVTPIYRLDVAGIVNATDFYKNGAPFNGSRWAAGTGGITYAGGKVAVGTTRLDATLTVQPGQGNLASTEGDFKIGDATHSLKIGVATAASTGIAAGDVRIRASGGSAKLVLGSGTTDVLTVARDSIGNARVAIGTTTVSSNYVLNVNGAINATEIYRNGVAVGTGGGSGGYLSVSALDISADQPMLTLSSDMTGTRWQLGTALNSLVLGGDQVGNLIVLSGGSEYQSSVKYDESLKTLGVVAEEPVEIQDPGPYIEPTEPTVTIYGDLVVTGAKTGYVVDQFVNASGEALERGDVVVIGANQASQFYGITRSIPIPEVDVTAAAYDRRVCGIVDRVEPWAGAGAQPLRAEAPTAEEAAPKKRGRKRKAEPEAASAAVEPAAAPGTPVQRGTMVTLGAYAHCKVDADIAPIAVGDLLTTSPTRGHAQKVTDPAQAIGAIVAKALAPLESGRGTIPVMVIMQ
jgi:hypothetical protein